MNDVLQALRDAQAEISALRAKVGRVQRLAEQWNETPDYTLTHYDRGRVDQRHEMTTQLFEALSDDG